MLTPIKDIQNTIDQEHLFLCKLQSIDDDLKYNRQRTDFETEFQVDELDARSFLSSKKEFIQTSIIVLRERLGFLKFHERYYGRRTERHLYFVSLWLKQARKNILVISMLVSVMHTIQEHMFIVKNPIFQTLASAKRVPQVNHAAFLLHSFTASLFDKRNWVSSPMKSMIQLLDKYRVRNRPSTQEEKNETSRSNSLYYGGCTTAVDCGDASNAFNMPFCELWRSYGLIFMGRFITADENQNTGSKKGWSDTEDEEDKRRGRKHKRIRGSEHVFVGETRFDPQKQLPT